jgi:hypothetical protein
MPSQRAQIATRGASNAAATAEEMNEIRAEFIEIASIFELSSNKLKMK